MGALWRLVEAYRDEQEYRPSVAQVADKAGMNRSTLNRWQQLGDRLPEQRHLRAIASVIGQPYRVVLDAALVDAGYLTAGEAQPRQVIRLVRPLGAAARPPERKRPKED